jgi:uncharacterized protein DUF4129
VNAAFPQAPPDSVRAVLRQVFAAREYDWKVRRRTLSWLQDLWERGFRWLDALHAAHPVVYYSLLGLVTALLVALLAHLSYVVWRALRPKGPAEGAVAAAPGPGGGVVWHLSEARRLSAAGRYAEALAHRFIALVLELDRQRAVQFHPSKTPAEYVAEARLGYTARSEFADLVGRLYQHVFGGAPCGPEDWGLFDSRASAVAASHVAAR